MIKHNQRGAVSVLLISLVLTALLLCGAVAFGAWAYTSRQDYKSNVDQKVAIAVAQAQQRESTIKDQQFAEAAKQPLVTYKGPEAYGSLVVKYPKTWSGYVDDTGGSGGQPLNGYFYPGVVPSLTSLSSAFALRTVVLTQSYDSAVQQFTALAKSGKVTVAPYALPKVNSVIGVRIKGQLSSQKTGTMVVLPLRDKTLELWTEAPQFEADFASNILPNVDFSP